MYYQTSISTESMVLAELGNLVPMCTSVLPLL